MLDGNSYIYQQNLLGDILVKNENVLKKNQHVNGLISTISNSNNIGAPYPFHSNTRTHISFEWSYKAPIKVLCYLHLLCYLQRICWGPLCLRLITIRSSHQRCSIRKGVLEISQNSQENTCARVSFLIKLQAYTFLIEHLLVTAPFKIKYYSLYITCSINF